MLSARHKCFVRYFLSNFSFLLCSVKPDPHRNTNAHGMEGYREIKSKLPLLFLQSTPRHLTHVSCSIFLFFRFNSEIFLRRTRLNYKTCASACMYFSAFWNSFLWPLLRSHCPKSKLIPRHEPPIIYYQVVWFVCAALKIGHVNVWHRKLLLFTEEQEWFDAAANSVGRLQNKNAANEIKWQIYRRSRISRPRIAFQVHLATEQFFFSNFIGNLNSAVFTSAATS